MKQTKPIYAFIDSQNLNLGVKSLGWNLDWKKFRQYLKNKFHIEKALLFIGYKPGNEKLYTSLQQFGYLVVLKPTLELPDGTVKGNVDAELVLHTMIEHPHYSRLFKPFSGFIIQIAWLKGNLEQKKTGISGRSKP